jgi:hypothetical protein
MLRKAVVVAMVMTVAAISALAGAKCADKCDAKAADACCKAGDTVYACTHCSVVDVKAGKCSKCKADLAASHVLAMKDDKVSLCSCEAGCKCTVKADDPKQCSCGKAVTTLDCATACAVPKKVEAPKAKPAAESAKPKDHPAH